MSLEEYQQLVSDHRPHWAELNMYMEGVEFALSALGLAAITGQVAADSYALVNTDYLEPAERERIEKRLRGSLANTLYMLTAVCATHGWQLAEIMRLSQDKIERSNA